MKKILVFLSIIALAAVTFVSCQKKTPAELAIEQVQKACIGTWTGTVPHGNQVEVTFSPDFKITTTGNFSAQIVSWDYQNGTVYAELNDHTNMAIAVSGVKMYITSNSLTVYASLPSELSKLLK